MKLPRLGGVRAVHRLCIIYLGTYHTTEIITENLSQVRRMALGRSAPNAIRIADMAIAGDGLPWPVGPWRPWLSHQAVGSTLVHGKYLPSCRTRMFLTSSNFESKQAARVLMWSANSGTPRSSCICLLLMYQGAPAFRPGSLLTCHCLPSLFFRRTSS